METPPGEIPYADWNDPDDAWQESSRLRRRLWAVEQKYAAAMEELEAAREALGYYKIPFRFLELPREIRDKIYRYALQAPTEARPRPIPAIIGMAPFKPPTPGLCLLNRQLYAEANEVLYTKNTFAFDEPQHLLDFLKEIGATNETLIRSISISVDFSAPVMLFGGIGTESLYWASALTGCDLKGVVSMRVRASCVDGQYAFASVDSALEHAIKDILLRDKEGGATRRLRFTGFGCDERKKFPEDWKISTEQSHEEELLKCRHCGHSPLRLHDIIHHRWGPAIAHLVS